MKHFFILGTVLCFVTANLFAQKKKADPNPVYVDKKGVLRWSSNKSEASFFGVNYTTPFAYAYRAHKALNADLEKAIQQDVYHMSRLGFDAFRVHVWDTEISDSAGNLLNNDHLRLFDFLLAELKKRNIKTIITPIAFWGNGYPERDEPTPGFSRIFGRGKLTTNDTAIKAQENYLKQFFAHVNPYTNLTYRDDPDVIAAEINNEPAHSGPKPGVTDYVNRLAAALRSTGWTKPVYYNISQGPYYGDAVANSNIDGVSFQWYPSGLVSNNTLKDNYLPHVDRYAIPFDTIPAYLNKTRMVYEFDAADILQSYMYPAMARSFREAGFQWATQFAYDPMVIGHINTEYQTHYLNLAYTPSKAISMLIASEVFHKMPRLKDYGVYPADSSFDVFRVSYRESLSEMNTEEKFYYSNATSTSPKDQGKLKKIAGVGNSPVVKYDGTGAYFLDKLEDGVWRLELMPDVIYIRNPFERTSPKKEVARIQWTTREMQLSPDLLGPDFSIAPLNEGNTFSATAKNGAFTIKPGTYLLTRKEKHSWTAKSKWETIELGEFAAPKSSNSDIFLVHEPYTEVTGNTPLTIKVKIAGLDSGTVSMQVNPFGWQGRMIPMQRTGDDYTATIPADLVVPGQMNYRFIIQKGNEYTSFPGNIKGNPFSWENAFNTDRYKTWVAGSNSRLEIYNPSTDQNVQTYPVFNRNVQTNYTNAEKASQLIFRMTASQLPGDHTMGFQYYMADKLAGRITELSSFTKLVVRARTGNDQPVKAKITLIDADAKAVSSFITLNKTFNDTEIPLSSFAADSAMLLPRPYPGFMPLWFNGGKMENGLSLKDIKKIEVSIGSDLLPADFNKAYSMEVEAIWLRK